MPHLTAITALILLAVGGAQIVLSVSARSLRALHTSIVAVLTDLDLEFEDAPDRVCILDGVIRFEVNDDPDHPSLVLSPERTPPAAGPGTAGEPPA